MEGINGGRGGRGWLDPRIVELPDSRSWMETKQTTLTETRDTAVRRTGFGGRGDGRGTAATASWRWRKGDLGRTQRGVGDRGEQGSEWGAGERTEASGAWRPYPPPRRRRRGGPGRPRPCSDGVGRTGKATRGKVGRLVRMGQGPWRQGLPFPFSFSF